ncbi:MAG: hypothetical protein FJ146_14765, partial [Deltaproteobacteria bacterium]|nr:hypothetical protein [Deltaproteobacteria bacterium]
MTKLGVRQDFRSLLATGLMIALGLLTFTCTKKRSPLQVDDGNDTTEDTYDQYGQDPAARLSTLAERLIKDMVMAVGPSGEHADQNSLSESDAMVVSKAATDAVIAAGVSTSTDATKLVGVIIYGAASALPVAPISINDHGRVSALTGLMASGLFASLKDLDAANLPQGSATVGMTAKATAHTAIANGAVRSLANSVIPVSDMAHVIDDVSQSIVAQVGETGSNEATILQYDLPAIAAGITTGVAALPAGAGDKRSLIRSASEGAVRGLGSIAALLPSNGSIGRAITVLVSSMTENLDVFSIESDSIRFFAAEVTSGAEAAVDSVVTAYAGSSVSRSDLVLATTNGSFEGLNIVASKVAAVASRAVSPSIASTLPSTPAPAASSVQSPGGSNAGATLNLSGISIDANGNFGIGTETPAARLHVSGSAGTDGIMFPDGTVQRTAAIGAGSSQWTTAGSNIYFNAGNVGIGTTAPASTLEVTGNIMMSQGANRTISVATTTSNTAGNSLTI